MMNTLPNKRKNMDSKVMSQEKSIEMGLEHISRIKNKEAYRINDNEDIEVYLNMDNPYQTALESIEE